MAPSAAPFAIAVISFLLLPLPSITQHISDTQSFPAHTSQTGSRCFTASTNLSQSTLKVLVPNRTFFTQFVDCSDPDYVRGFSVDVFKAASAILTPKPFWDNVSVDAVVGDVTIGADRSENATFTQPYAYSGIVILAPTVVRHNPVLGVFFTPFTAWLWVSIGAFGIVTGCALWWLEKNSHGEFKPGPVKLRIQKSLWFVVQLMVFFKHETLTNLCSKVVLVSWIAFTLVLGSAYTASFAATLTARKVAPRNYSTQQLQGVHRIGYQNRSIVYDYLTKVVGIKSDRLVALTTTKDYSDSLLKGPYKAGGVDLIIDEAPYVNLFLSGLPVAGCNYSTVGPKLASGGFGFAFPLRLANLSKAFSMAILNLSENGELRKLQIGAQITDYNCPTQFQAAQLDLISSEWLFVLLGLMSIVCVVAMIASESSKMINWARNKGPTADLVTAIGDASAADESPSATLALWASPGSSRRLVRPPTFPLTRQNVREISPSPSSTYLCSKFKPMQRYP